MIVGEDGKLKRGVPDALMSVLARIGRHRDVLEVGRLTGTGNSSYLVSYPGDRIVVRFDGDETDGLVDRELEYRHGYLAARQELGPEILYADLAGGILITRFVEGIRFDRLTRPFSCASLGHLAQLIGKLQASEGFDGLMDPWQKISLYLDDADLGEPETETNFGPFWSSLDVLRCKTAVDPDDLVACHVDPVPENLLDREQCAILLDWEYAARSHRLWDIAYFASEARLTDDERVRLLHAFGQAEKQKEFQQWIVVAKAVSFAWCLARRVRALEEREIWDMALEERRFDLQRCLEAI